MTHTSPHQAGFVSIIGKPNAGKSTLMNVLVGNQLSITNNKAQTTRHRICGIANGDNFQIVYIDTPGIITPAYALQKTMMEVVNNAITDADILLWIIDVSDREIPTWFKKESVKKKKTILLLINKIDLLTNIELENVICSWLAHVQAAHIIPISALQECNISHLLKQIVSFLPRHPPYYDKEVLTDKPERFYAAEIIREKILLNYYQEIPYSVEVVVEAFKMSEKTLKIDAVIYVERKSQKGILIGKEGKAIQELKLAAQVALSKFFNRRTFLLPYIKVMPDWRKKEKSLKKFGYITYPLPSK